MTITEEERNLLIKNYVSKSNATIGKEEVAQSFEDMKLVIKKIEELI